jgi:ankyrin repeat protein
MVNITSLRRLLSVCYIIFLLPCCRPWGMQGDADVSPIPAQITIADSEAKEEASLGELSEEIINSQLKDSRPYTTFYWGLEHKNFQAIQRSLEEIDVTKNGFNVSLQFGNNDQIIEIGPVGKYHNTSTLLHLAVMYDNTAAAKLLIGCEELDVNQRDQFGKTPLYWAVKVNNPEIVKLLLARDDINVKQTNNNGITPLHWAVTNKNLEIIKLLLAREDININQTNQSGSTPLHWALQDDNLEVVKLFLGHKHINVNQGDEFSKTPLHWAINTNNAEIVKLLLACRDIDINQKDQFGNTALYAAIIQGNTEIIALLLACEAVDLNLKNDFGATQLQLIASICPYRIITAVVPILEEKLRLARVCRLGAVYEKFSLGREAAYSHYDRQVLKMVLAYAEFNLTLSNHEGKTCADLLRDRGMEAEADRIEAIIAKYLNQEKRR